MEKIWQIKSSPSPLAAQISQSLGLSPIIAQLLTHREIDSVHAAEQFLKSDLTCLHDPMLFKDMQKVLERLFLAQKNRERVLVFGDYDVDGVASSAMLYKLLTSMGIEVINHIPHRMTDGYGLNGEIGAFALQKGIKLIITIDCGITAQEEVEHLNSLGIEIIIIDHHEPGDDPLPKALAIINPKQKDCRYPFKELASVGLVAKLVQAVEGKFNEDYLDLVAMGTIADVAPLRDENRVFVKLGLPKIDQTKNKGLMALLEVAKIKGKKITPYHVGFILGPRINATGRMDSAHKSLNLLLSGNMEEAYSIAQEIEKHNVDRQKLQRNVIDEAMDIIEREVNFTEHKVIVLSKEGWHKGVLGIVASRITDKYYRPSIVISVKDGVGTASARSIDGFHLHEALTHCSGCLENFGGHEGAAGLTIKEENIDPFRKLINDLAQKTMEVKDILPVLPIDAQIPLSSINLNLIDQLDALEPFGESNAEPVFCSKELMVKSAPVCLGKETLKFWVTDGKVSFSAVGFGMAKYKDLVKLGQKIDLAYTLSIDDWNKAPTPQLKLKDIK